MVLAWNELGLGGGFHRHSGFLHHLKLASHDLAAINMAEKVAIIGIPKFQTSTETAILLHEKHLMFNRDFPSNS